MRQRTHLASVYAAKFQQLTRNLDWNDKALTIQFRYGLKDNVKDLLHTMSKVDTLEDFDAQSIAWDNWLFEKH